MTAAPFHTGGMLSWPLAFRRSAPYAGLLAGAYLLGACGLRAIVAHQLGRAFMSPTFAVLLISCMATALAAWPLLAHGWRRAESAAIIRDVVQWILTGGIIAIGLFAAWALLDSMAIEMAAKLVAPDLLK